ncbi:MAG: RIO1 family regulatory kinase/ATPase [Archangium sp.]|nr:RIO1 family regulatory kinase/ATPase [Archangium sp.]MDP3156439.1 RIO1 family regulatory kinase/ATPase [Archangium sp.]MDP3573115.1 RIO1 family regulatory kinase/ATPase [Archangium sp.]
MDRLQQLLEEGVIDEVFNQLKTGKEAEVWLVSHKGEPVAAKIYKAREFRSFKNDAGYKEGRVVRNTRTQRAMDKGSKFGRASAEEAWKSAEADVMFTLHSAGVRVPKPVLFYDGVLLMEVIGDAEGRVAPRLVEAAITREQAEPMYVLLRQEIIKILSHDFIHGDLSEFNILLGSTGPIIIDFPQVVTAAKNSQSEKYFRRDLGNLLRFFSSIDPGVSKHASDADEIWREYVRRDLSANYVPSGRVHQQQSRPPHGGGRGGPPRQAQGQGPGQQRGPGQQAPAQQQRGQGAQRGPGLQQQQGGRGPPQQQNQARPPQGQQQSQSRPPGQQQNQARPPGQQQNQARPPGQQPQRPQGQAPAQRRGPEVVFRGPATPRTDAGPGAARKSGAGRRRPPRRF